MLTLAWGRGKWAFPQKRLMIQNLCVLYILFTQNTCEYFFCDIVTLVHIIFITIKLYYIVKRTTSNRVILTIALKIILFMENSSTILFPQRRKTNIQHEIFTLVHIIFIESNYIALLKEQLQIKLS